MREAVREVVRVVKEVVFALGVGVRMGSSLVCF